MIVKINKVQYNLEVNGYLEDFQYDLNIPDDKIIEGITTSKFPTYWYALID